METPRPSCRFGVLALLLAVLASGCAGYRLGPTNGLAAREKSIQITPFSNQTFEPRLADPVNSQLRKQIQRDGTFELATRDEGDILVTGIITEFDRMEITFVPSDLMRARDYRLRVTAHVTARDRISDKLLLDKNVSGTTLVRVGNDLTSAERQALPLLAEDLAKNITALLADGSW